MTTEARYAIGLVDRTRGAFNNINRNLGKLQRNLKATGAAVQGTGRALSTNLSMPIALVGAVTLKAAGDFEMGMNKVQALTSATGSEFDALSNQAKTLGRTTMFSASQAAEGMGFLSMAGFEAMEVLGAMPGTLQLAAAANMELGQTADIVSNILVGYNKDVEELGHVNDVLVSTFISSNTNLEMLGETMKYVAPLASGLGMKFEETAALAGLLGNAGIQASLAGTSLRSALATLSNPTADQAEAMDRLNLSVFDSEGKMRSFADILRQLEAAGAGPIDMMKIFQKRAGPAMIAVLAQGSDALDLFTDSLENSGGTAERIADVQMRGFNGQMRALKSAVEGFMLEVAASGMLEFFTDLGLKLTTALQNMAKTSKGTLALGVKIAGLAAAVGPVLFVFGKLLTLIAAVSNPIGLTIVAVAALTAAYVAFGDRATSVADGAFGRLKEAFSGFIGNIKEAGATLLEFLSPALDFLGVLAANLGGILIDTLGWAFGVLGVVIRGLVDILNAVLGPALAYTAKVLNHVMPVAVNFATAALDTLKVIALGVAIAVLQVFESIAAAAGWISGKLGLEGMEEWATGLSSTLEGVKQSLADMHPAAQAAVGDTEQLKTSSEDLAKAEEEIDRKRKAREAELKRVLGEKKKLAAEALLEVQRINEAEEAQAELMKRGAELFKETRNEAEKYAGELAELHRLLAHGAITQNTYNRALNTLNDGFSGISETTDDMNRRAELSFETLADAANDAAGDIAGSFAAAMFDAELSLKGFADWATQVLREIAEAIIRLGLINPAINAGISYFGGGPTYTGPGPMNPLGPIPLLANGGAARAYRPHIVGDGGEPELFTPGVSGTVTPLSQLGGQKVDINLHITAFDGEDAVRVLVKNKGVITNIVRDAVARTGRRL